jgi:hypothetical protein
MSEQSARNRNRNRRRHRRLEAEAAAQPQPTVIDLTDGGSVLFARPIGRVHAAIEAAHRVGDSFLRYDDCTVPLDQIRCVRIDDNDGGA